MKSYAQFCPLATALDVIGDRWTLLIVRELMFLGPRRFTDLAEGLPGIAPNLLSARLKALDAAGLVERSQLPPPAASTVYRLTPEGEGLREPVLALVRWGLPRLPSLGPDETVRPEFPLIALQAAFVPRASRGVHEEYELLLDGTPHRFRVDDGTLAPVVPGAEPPAVRLTATLRGFAEVATGQRDATEAVAAGDLAIESEPDALGRFLAIFAASFRPRTKDEDRLPL